MRLIRQWAICILVAIISPAYAEGISGTYVGKGADSAILVQLVQTGDGHLTGRYEQIALRANNKLERMNASINGSTDGRTVVVTIKPAEFLSGSFETSGTIEGSILHLNGGGYGSNLNLSLVKSEEADFRAQVTLLSNQQTLQSQVKEQKDFVAHVKNLNQKLVAFSSAAETKFPKFESIEQRYRKITEAMRAGLKRQQSIYGEGQASVARGQISVAINQAGIDANQIHMEVQSAFSEFETSSRSLTEAMNKASSRCQETHEELKPACAVLINEFEKFQQSVQKLQTAFDKTESVWRDERQKQENIIQSAENGA